MDKETIVDKMAGMIDEWVEQRSSEFTPFKRSWLETALDWVENKIDPYYRDRVLAKAHMAGRNTSRPPEVLEEIRSLPSEWQMRAVRRYWESQGDEKFMQGFKIVFD